MTLRRWLACLAALGFASGAAWADARAELPPVVLGEPSAFAPRERLDALRQGRTRVALPTSPSLRWQLELHANLEHPPLVDGTGALVALLANGDLVRVALDGNVVWRRRLPCAVSNVPPALLAEDVALVVCGDGTLLRVDRDGRRLDSTFLDGSAVRANAAPLVREDATVVVALDDQLVHVSSEGIVLARARLGLTEVFVGGLMPFDGGVLAVDARGDVWFWRAPAVPRKLGSFGGSPPAGAVVLGTRALTAVVSQESRVVVLDPVTQRTSVLALGDAALGLRFDGPPSLAPNGELLLTTSLGEVLALTSSGEVTRRIAFDVPEKLADSRFRTATTVERRAPLVVDARGNAVTFTRSGQLVILTAEGPLHTLKGRACARPLAVLPAGERRVITACADGNVASWSQP